MKPYAEIRTERLRAALAETKTCCAPCKKGKPCKDATKTEAEIEADKRSFIDRVVSRLTGNS